MVRVRVGLPRREGEDHGVVACNDAALELRETPV
jgi:hypothetical protein